MVQKILKRVLSGLLLIIALGLFLYPNLREIRTSSEVTEIADELPDTPPVPAKPEPEPTEPTEPEEPEEPETPAGAPQVQAIPLPELYKSFTEYNRSLITDGQEITDAWEGSPEAPNISALDDGLLGYIEVPDMGIELPLYVGASYSHLSDGAAIQWGTSMPIGGVSTNCVVVGHRGWYGSRYFAYINRMTEGSRVYLHTPWGILTYEAAARKIISPDDLESVSIQPGKDMVTLLSCHPYAAAGGAKYRYLVYCERVPGDPYPTADEPEQEPKPSETPLPYEEDSIPEVEADPSGTDDLVTVLELNLTRYLPPITLVLCALILFLRSRDGKPKKKKRRNG